MSEIEVHSGSRELDSQMMYARAVASGSMLPDQYRNNPANVLIAVGLGQSMGLSPAESLYRINVIKGKPTASAELIAANVRRAGHKLRVRADEAALSVVATIVRADDPEFEHTVTRDKAWAQQMGLATNDNYRKQPLTMLQWRAITAVARLACPEALYGVSYTPDEMYDTRPQQGATVAEQVNPQPSGAEVAPEDGPSPAAPVEESTSSAPEPLTERTRGAIFALFAEHGVTERDGQLTYIADVLGRDLGSRADLTEADGRAVEKALRDDQAPIEDAGAES